MLHDTPAPCRYLRTYRIHGCTVLEFHGEIDLAAAIEITPQLDVATAPPEPLVAIDLTPVTFLDCSGLNLLCRAHRRITARYGNLQLVCSHPPALRLLRAARLTDTFHPVSALDEALDRLHPQAGGAAARGTARRQQARDNSG
ncbi:STAS domain-containing protein [Streptomyces sp. NPDC050516]|uniref:STAS domain-containing protein n=1 Tax=Streptomyces sp. NPDC050516 TaxID=3365621 RepID=UPI0037A0AF70